MICKEFIGRFDHKGSLRYLEYSERNLEYYQRIVAELMRKAELLDK